jgi:hypothetical protein
LIPIMKVLRQNYYLLTLLILAIATHSSSHAMDKQFTSGETKVVLVELFTSEGCSSCPPAEKWMNSLKDDARLWKKFVPVAFHVDYWDYIGWKDPYANSANGVRQRKYQQQGNIHTVYTPGIVIDGVEWRNWRSRRYVPLSDKTVGKLDVMVRGNNVSAEFTPEDEQATEWELNVALLGFNLSSLVRAGENTGRKLEHQFVVLSHQREISDNHSWQLKLPVVNTGSFMHTGLAVWVNKKGRQAPVQATGGWLSK